MDGLAVQDVLQWVESKDASLTKLHCVVPEDTLGAVVKAMAEHNQTSLPVIENVGKPGEKYHGTIDLTDIVGLAMGLLGPGEVQANWKSTIEGVMKSKVVDLETEYLALPDDSRADVTDALPKVVRQGFVRAAYHSLTIFSGEHAAATLSQSELVAYIAAMPSLLGKKASCPVSRLGLISSTTTSTASVELKVTEQDTVLDALRLAHAKGKRETAVVDASGKLVGAINAEAIKGLADLSVLQLPISEYKKLHPIATPVIIAPDATLADIVAAVGPARAVRAYAVDARGQPVFLMTLNRILRSIINSGWELNDITVAKICKVTGRSKDTLETIDADKTIGDALKQLSAHNMLTLPVLREGHYVGMIDIMDILGEIIVNLEERQRGTLREQDHKAAAYLHGATDKEIINEVTAKVLSSLSYTAKDLVKDSDTLFDCLVKTFLPNRYHRVSVQNAKGDIVDVLSQRDISRFIGRHPDILGDRGDQTIENLGFLTRKIRTVGHRDSMMKAFQIMHHANSRAIAVVNGKGQLMSNVHVGDLKGNTTFYHLRLMICFAKSKVPNPEDFPPDSIPMELPLTCTKDSTLREVLFLMVKHAHRRVYVIDQAGHPLSEVTLTDIFKSLVKPGADGLFSKKN